MSTLRLEIPAKIAECLQQPSRYKVLYGGRGSGKSWSVARYLLVMGITRKIRVLCTRETQKSIADSVHKLLSDQIGVLKLGAYYEIQKATIINRQNGTEFLFSGLRDAANLKSFEGVDICWVEEAQTVTDESWAILIPTIRKDNSEIWVVFNPRLDTDPTYKRYVVEPPDNCRSAFVNYWDNPWFPDVLRGEMEQLKRRSRAQYLHVWEGSTIIAPEGAVFDLTWFHRYHSLPSNPTRIIHSWDTAYKAGTHNDPSCCTVWHITPTMYYLADVIHGKFEYPDLRKKAFELANEQKPHAILIEDKASGQSLIQEFQTLSNHPVIPMKPVSDKETRARVEASAVEAGRVAIPHSAPWLGEFEAELMLFPSEEVHDDRVDSVSQFLRYMRENDHEDFSDTLKRIYG